METLLFYFAYFFTPHHANNHRPRALHASTLSFLAVFLLVVQVGMQFIHRVRPDILGFATNINVEKLLEFTNEERLKNGVKPVVLSPILSEAARKKAEDMFAKNYWAHTAPDGATPWNFIIGAGYKYTYAGENLARDFDNSQGVVEAWMNSPSHRDNLVRGEYEEIGFAVVNGTLNGSETTLVVQMFGTRRPSVVAKSNLNPQIPIAAAQENVPSVPPAILTEAITPTPVPVRQVAQVIETFPEATYQSALVTANSVNRMIALIITSVLLMVLMVDGFIIWRKKTVRIAGHNLAHFIFLLAIAGIVVIGTSGAIL